MEGNLRGRGQRVIDGMLIFARWLATLLIFNRGVALFDGLGTGVWLLQERPIRITPSRVGRRLLPFRDPRRLAAMAGQGCGMICI
jgi:hypothetical protein